MELPLEQAGDVTIVTLPVDELDASNAADLKRDVAALLEEHTKLVFDLSRLRFIDSSGLGAFLSCLRKATARGGDLKLCGLTKHVRSVFELVRMHRIFELFDTRDAAVKGFSEPRHASTSAA